VLLIVLVLEMFEDSKGEIKNVNRRRTNNTMVKNYKLGERTRVLWNGEQLLPHSL
jgi:hypothetical protein